MGGPMTDLPSVLAEHEIEPIPGAPRAAATVRPPTRDALAETLAACSADGLAVAVWGGGTHQGIGHRVAADVVLSTTGLDRVTDHQPEDLTLTVEAGVTLAAVADVLGPHRQFAVLPETSPEATIGGVLAAGASGYRRLRYGPTRDHVLEVTLVTGDGRLVRAGARVVKHVQGYDLMRLVCGSLGSVGVVVEACLKLWPEPPALATVAVADPTAALATAFRPQAVLETPAGTSVMLAGTPEEVAAQAADLGGDPSEGHRWPDPPDPDTERGRWSIRVPAPAVPDVVSALPAGSSFVAEHGVGVVTAALGGPDAADLRVRAERLGGSVVLLDGPDHLYADPGPWGADPPALGLQRRIVARFDPDRVLNPGRPAGGL